MPLAAAVFADWKTGQAEALAALSAAAGAGAPSPVGGDAHAAVAGVVRAVLAAAVAGSLSPDDAAVFLAEEAAVAAVAAAADMPLLVADVLQLLDTELQHGRPAAGDGEREGVACLCWPASRSRRACACGPRAVYRLYRPPRTPV